MAPSKIGTDPPTPPEPQFKTIQCVTYCSISGGFRFPVFSKPCNKNWSVDKPSLEFPYVYRYTALSPIVAPSPRAKASFEGEP